MSDWQPIETAPYETDVLVEVDDPDERVVVGSRTKLDHVNPYDDGWCLNTAGAPKGKPTGWMPLPEPRNIVRSIRVGDKVKFPGDDEYRTVESVKETIL